MVYLKRATLNLRVTVECDILQESHIVQCDNVQLSNSRHKICLFQGRILVTLQFSYQKGLKK